MPDDTRIEESKFQLGPIVSFESGDLPWSYGENRLTALVRDPDSAFLYWEVTDDGIAAARATCACTTRQVASLTGPTLTTTSTCASIARIANTF
jgi:hypothetical protein